MDLAGQISAGMWGLLTTNLDILPTLTLTQWQIIFDVIGFFFVSLYFILFSNYVLYDIFWFYFYTHLNIYMYKSIYIYVYVIINIDR